MSVRESAVVSPCRWPCTRQGWRTVSFGVKGDGVCNDDAAEVTTKSPKAPTSPSWYNEDVPYTPYRAIVELLLALSARTRSTTEIVRKHSSKPSRSDHVIDGSPARPGCAWQRLRRSERICLQQQ